MVLTDAQKRATAKWRAKNKEILSEKNKLYLKNRYINCQVYRVRQNTLNGKLLEEQILRSIRKLFL